MHPAAGGTETDRAPVTISRAYRGYALGLLAFINLLNYLDRNVIFALFEPIKRDLGLTDTQLGWLGSAYILVFSVAALPFGVISDLRSRRAVIAAGVTVWSVFTFLGGLVRSYWQLFTCRAAVGIGEAAFGPAAASLVADYFPGKGRAGAMGVLASGIALGGVLGIGLGGLLEQYYGWRIAFMVVGMPGLFCAFLAARLIDPTRVPTQLTFRGYLRNVGGRDLGALQGVRLHASWACSRGLTRRLRARQRVRRDVAARRRGVRRGGGAGPRARHRALGTARAPGRVPEDAVRRRRGERVRRHRGRRPAGAEHAHAELRVRGRRDDLVRDERARGVGADVHRARAGALVVRGGDAAREVGARLRHRRDPRRRGARRLAPALHRARTGDRGLARAPHRRAARHLAAQRYATRPSSRRSSSPRSSSSPGTTARSRR